MPQQLSMAQRSHWRWLLLSWAYNEHHHLKKWNEMRINERKNETRRRIERKSNIKNNSTWKIVYEKQKKKSYKNEKFPFYFNYNSFSCSETFFNCCNLYLNLIFLCVCMSSTMKRVEFLNYFFMLSRLFSKLFHNDPQFAPGTRDEFPRKWEYRLNFFFVNSYPVESVPRSMYNRIWVSSSLNIKGDTNSLES